MLSPSDFLADVEVAVTSRMADPLQGCAPNGRAGAAREVVEVQEAVDAASGSRPRLSATFTDLVLRRGRGRASRLWMAVFGAEDAADT